MAGIEGLFAPLERIIRDHFLSSLIGIPACEIDGDYQNLLTHSVNTGGLTVRNPCETAEYAFETLKMMTRHLVISLAKNDILLDPNEHRMAVSLACFGDQK